MPREVPRNIHICRDPEEVLDAAAHWTRPSKGGSDQTATIDPNPYTSERLLLPLDLLSSAHFPAQLYQCSPKRWKVRHKHSISSN